MEAEEATQMEDLFRLLAFIGLVSFLVKLGRGRKKRSPPVFDVPPEHPLDGIHYLIATRSEWSPHARHRLPLNTAVYDESTVSGGHRSGAGVVYILINASLPGFLKVGMTTRSAEGRARELSQVTGVAAEFVVAFEQSVSDCREAERRVHEALTAYRYNDSREFFRLPLKDAIRIVSELCIEIDSVAPAGITPEVGLAQIAEADQTEATSRYSVAVRCRHCALHFPVSFPTSSPVSCPECGKSNAAAAGREAMNLARTFLTGDSGRGIPRDVHRAIHHVRQAARWGSAEAEAWLASRPR